MLQSQTATQTTPFIPAAVKSSAPARTIELERVIINEDVILVQSTSTCWVNTTRLKVDIEGLPKLYAEVVKLAKGAGAKISKIRVNPRNSGRGYKREPRSGSSQVWPDFVHILSVFR